MAFLLILGACAQTSMTPAAKSAAAHSNPTESLTSLEADLAEAKQNQVHLLSPNWYSQAEGFYIKAKKGVEEGTEISKILENIIKAEKALQDAEETTEISRTMLPNVIESRNKAQAAGAAYLGQEYDAVEKQFLKLTRAIENNNIGSAKRKAPKVSEAYLALELSAIKTGTIKKVRPVLEQAENEKASKYVPQSLSLAQKYFDDTDNFITQNRYAKEEIDKKVQESMFIARRTVVLNNQSKKLDTMKSEEIALWMEKNLHRITTQLSAQDMRNRSENIQIENILGSIKSLQAENRSLNEQLISQQHEFQKKSSSYQSNIALLNQRIAVLEGSAEKAQKATSDLLAEQRAIEQKLIAEREFNKKFLEVQTFFRANEAEIYKQRNQLVIRLKAIRFPIGSAIIIPENYALLSKVQQAIQIFDGPSVVIEGHTDSTGADEANQILSKQRAEAVHDYLVANKTIPADKIHYKGYGATRPLASNATPEGRAVNRRIDVLINPPVVPSP
jgi:outer membrane protein OmpA-like peptidoglycan-associated protein